MPQQFYETWDKIVYFWTLAGIIFMISYLIIEIITTYLI